MVKVASNESDVCRVLVSISVNLHGNDATDAIVQQVGAQLTLGGACRASLLESGVFSAFSFLAIVTTIKSVSPSDVVDPDEVKGWSCERPLREPTVTGLGDDRTNAALLGL